MELIIAKKSRKAYYREYDRFYRKERSKKVLREYYVRYEKHRKKRDRRKYFSKYNQKYYRKNKMNEAKKLHGGITKMEVEYKGYVVRGTPQDIRELIMGGMSVVNAKESVFGDTKKKYVMSGKYRKKRAYTKKNMSFWKHDKNVKPKRKYVMSGKYAKKKNGKLFTMSKTHKEAIRKGVAKFHNSKKKASYKMSKKSRDKIKKGMIKSWKKRNNKH